MNLERKDFIKLAENYQAEAEKLLIELLKFPSVLEEFKPETDAPFGVANKECLNYLLDLAQKDGFEVLNDDNYAGHIALGNGEELFGILGHLDVVPAVG